MTFVAVCNTQALPRLVTWGNNNNEFCFNVFEKMLINAEDSDNILFSPLSVNLGLSMLYLGSDDVIKGELARTLHLNRNSHYVARQLISYMPSETLKIFNTLFVSNDLEIENSYRRYVEIYYSGRLQTIDFTSTKRAEDIINYWIKRNTEDQIEEIQISNELPRRVSSVLISGLSFASKWKFGFEKQRTRRHMFYNGNKYQRVDMMSAYGSYNYTYASKLKSEIIELQYNDEQFSYYVILPWFHTDIQEVLERISENLVTEYISKMSSRNIQVQLPRFETFHQPPLINLLKEVGITHLFSSRSSLNSIGDDIGVDGIYHKSKFEVSSNLIFNIF